MNIKKIIELSSNPKPYDVGTAVMWTDARITPRLLDAHLDTVNDAASRTPKKIDKTLKFISDTIGNKKSNILDLGCGPGLYTERLSKLGHRVTGIDFSSNSIEHAKENAQKKNLNIEYICQNYLELDFENTFDLVILIYCDFGVLSIKDRTTLIGKIYKALKPDGAFIFDALNKNILESFAFTQSWDCSNGGFWRSSPYISLSENLHFEKEKAILEQHIVIEENNEYEIYRFWNHYFDKTDVTEMFLTQGFTDVVAVNGVFDLGAQEDKGVTFYKITK